MGQFVIFLLKCRIVLIKSSGIKREEDRVFFFSSNAVPKFGQCSSIRVRAEAGLIMNAASSTGTLIFFCFCFQSSPDFFLLIMSSPFSCVGRVLFSWWIESLMASRESWEDNVLRMDGHQACATPSNAANKSTTFGCWAFQMNDRHEQSVRTHRTGIFRLCRRSRQLRLRVRRWKETIGKIVVNVVRNFVFIFLAFPHDRNGWEAEAEKSMTLRLHSRIQMAECRTRSSCTVPWSPHLSSLHLSFALFFVSYATSFNFLVMPRQRLYRNDDVDNKGPRYDIDSNPMRKKIKWWLNRTKRVAFLVCSHLHLQINC